MTSFLQNDGNLPCIVMQAGGDLPQAQFVATTGGSGDYYIHIRDVHSRPKSRPNHGTNTAYLSSRENTKTCKFEPNSKWDLVLGFVHLDLLRPNCPNPQITIWAQIWAFRSDLGHDLSL